MKVVLACAVLALSALSASRAAAFTYAMTYSGALAQGEDTLGLFGSAVQPGDRVTLTFLYDLDRGVRTGEDDVYDELDTFAPFTSQGVSSIIFSLDGYAYRYSPDIQADVSVGSTLYDITTGDYTGIGASANAVSSLMENSAVIMDVEYPSPLFTSLSRTGVMSGDGIGYFDTAPNDDGVSDNFIFEPFTVTISAAPEPGVWALLMTGVGLLGLALRRERSRGAPGRI